MKVTQPRTQNEEGDYFGCRAIRVVTDTLFEWLGLGPMLHRERAKASERLRRNAQKLNRKLSDFMGRMRDTFKKAGSTLFQQPSFRTHEKRTEDARRWNMACAKYMIAGCDLDECRRRTNAELGFPADYSPGRRT